MNIRKIAAITILVLSSFAANNVAPSKVELESMYNKAFREFDSNNFPEALKQLDAIDARQPDLAESQNLRGVILMRQSVYDKAEEALRKAVDLDPKFWNARFNLAEIPFLQRNWPEARKRFQELLSANASELQPEASQLIQYKILLTYLLEGKDDMVDSILAKFELSTDTPAVQYAKAAIALQHKNPNEAKEWTTTAEKNYSPALNKLFAESLYEVGWLDKPTGQTRAALELTSASERIARTKAYAKSKFEEASQAFQRRDLPTALRALDEADGHDPDQAPYLNLRGEIYMEKRDYDQAETLFKKTLKADPKFREAQYNLAQIPFKKKEYAKARDRLEALFNVTPGGDKNQAAQLIKFKIFLTLLLEGKDSRAQKMMEQFQFTGDTPALYYAQAAWEFKHQNSSKGNDWVTSAKKIYSPALNIVFADSFYDLGWLSSAPVSESAVSSAPFVAQTETTPGETGSLVEPSPIPGVALTRPQPATELEGEPGAVLSLDKTPVAGMEATTSNAPAPTVAANTPTDKTAGSLASKEIGSTTARTEPVPNAPVTNTSPATTASTATQPAPIVSSPAATISSTPATVLAPARVRELSRPSIGERLDRLMDQQTLLVGGLLLAGIILLAWGARALLRPESARGSAISIHRRSAPILEPRFQNIQPAARDEQREATPRLVGGPPQLSVQLKAAEPSVRRATLPVGKFARGTNGGAAISASPTVVETIAPPLPEQTFEPARAAVDVDVLSRAAAGEASEVLAAESAPTDESTGPVADQVIETVAQEEKLAEPVIEPPFVPPLPTFPSEFSTVSEPAVISAPEEITSWSPELSPINEQVIAPVESAATQSVAASEAESEPVGQGQPIPFQIPAVASAERAEVSEVEPAVSPPQPREGFFARAAAFAGFGASRPSVEPPPTPPVVSTEPAMQQSTTPEIMPEPTITPPTAGIRTTPSTGSSPATAAATTQTAVQITFSFEIASMQLTSSFKMGTMQLKPISKVVAMRLAPSQHPAPAMNLQVTFEIASVQLAGGSLGTIRLTPSQQQRPSVITTPSFAIAGLQLVSGSEAAPVQLTPSQQGQTSVHVTAAFHISTVEFSPSFEIASLVLNSASKRVSVQLPGAGPSAIEGAPVFEMTNVQLTGGGELGLVQLSPAGAAPRPA